MNADITGTAISGKTTLRQRCSDPAPRSSEASKYRGSMGRKAA